METLVYQSRSDLNYYAAAAAAAAAWECVQQEMELVLNIYFATCLFRPNCERGNDVSDVHHELTLVLSLKSHLVDQAVVPPADGRPRPACVKLQFKLMSFTLRFRGLQVT